MKPGIAACRQLLVVCSVLMLALPGSLALGQIRVAEASAVNCQPRASEVGRTALGWGLARVNDQTTLGPAAPLACPANLISLWKLDESSPSTYTDSSGGHNGTCTTNCPTATTGKVNGAQLFSASTQVNVAANVDFDWGVDTSFSIEAWMKTDAASTCAGTQPFIGRNAAGADTLHWWVGCESTSHAAFWLRDRGNTIAHVEGTTDVADGNWHHIVAVRDAAADELRLYVDASLQATASAIYSQGFDSATAPINLGWFQSDSALVYHFSGSVDELAVYSRALSADEIAAHVAKNQSGLGVCETVVLPFSVYLPVIVR